MHYCILPSRRLKVVVVVSSSDSFRKKSSNIIFCLLMRRCSLQMEQMSWWREFVRKNDSTHNCGDRQLFAASLTVPSLSSLQKTQNTVATATSMAMARERAITSSSDFSIDSCHSSERRTDVSMGSFPSKKPGWGPTCQGVRSVYEWLRQRARKHKYLNSPISSVTWTLNQSRRPLISDPPSIEFAWTWYHWGFVLALTMLDCAGTELSPITQSWSVLANE